MLIWPGKKIICYCIPLTLVRLTNFSCLLGELSCRLFISSLHSPNLFLMIFLMNLYNKISNLLPILYFLNTFSACLLIHFCFFFNIEWFPGIFKNRIQLGERRRTVTVNFRILFHTCDFTRH